MQGLSGNRRAGTARWKPSPAALTLWAPAEGVRGSRDAAQEIVGAGEDQVSGAGATVKPNGGYILEMESTGLAGELDIGGEVTSILT